MSPQFPRKLRNRARILPGRIQSLIPLRARAAPATSPSEFREARDLTRKRRFDDQFNPPDWFPEEHSPLPTVVQKGIQAQACGSCHLMSGMGHPESATLAGLSVSYMLRQMEDFKNGLRKDPKIHEQSLRAARMNIIAAGLPEEEMRNAIQWLAALKPIAWYKVEEAQTVRKSWGNGGRMRLPLSSGGTEPLGNRIITLPREAARVEARDPHCGFIAYVPPGKHQER